MKVPFGKKTRLNDTDGNATIHMNSCVDATMNRIAWRYDTPVHELLANSGGDKLRFSEELCTLCRKYQVFRKASLYSIQ